jgi:predicted TIM-barrel fold metal-dependent hydrolase
MLYRGIEFSVVQGIERHLWKWTATVSETKISGQSRTRDDAIDNAKKTIARAIQKQRFRQDKIEESTTQMDEDRDDF